MPDYARIELQEVAKVFRTPTGEVRAVDGVSLQVRSGEVFGVIGESGAGKSTLIRLVNLLERPTAGRVLFDGVDMTRLPAAELRTARRRIGMIFQHFNLHAARTVAQNVAFPVALQGRHSAGALKARVATLLDRVGLADQAHSYPAQLSGGQKQRVGLARALACEPSVLLCDEATSALDPQTTEQVLALLRELNRELGLTVILITHEMAVVRSVCDRVAVLDAGRVVESGDVVEVFLDPHHPATRRLLQEDPTAPDLGSLPGHTVRLIYRGEVTQDPLLGRIARETGVDYSLHAGRIARIKAEPYGQLTVTLRGGDIEGALARFEAAGVRVRELPA